MTLFWHNHFVSSQQKVRSPQLMYRQNVLLRSHALGNFGELLHAVARDPAMVIYLDNASNRKGQPNENFAREVMELFTLGEGNYSEHDIKEAARAFTGWSIDPRYRRVPVPPAGARRRREDRARPHAAASTATRCSTSCSRSRRRPSSSWASCGASSFRPSPIRRRCGASRAYSATPATTSARRCARCSSPTRSTRRRTARRWSSRRSSWSSARCASSDFTTGEVMPFVVHRQPARPEAVRAAQRQGLAGRRGVDQLDDAARAQAVPRAAVPGRGAARDAGGAMDGGGMDQPAGAARLRRGRERYAARHDGGSVRQRAVAGAVRTAASPAAVQRVLLATAPAAPAAPGVPGMDLIRQLDAGSGVSAQVMSDKR